MTNKTLFSIPLVIIVLLIVLIDVGELQAQIVGERFTLSSVASNPRPIRRAAAVQKPKVFTLVKTVKVPVTVKETVTRMVKTSNLTVSSEPGAKVVLESVAKKTPPIQKIIPDKGAVEFPDLKPGEYNISVTKDGFDPQYNKVLINPQEVVGVNLDLLPLTYTLIIQTNVKEGEVRYAPVKVIAKTADGKVKTEETSGYCIAPIQNGKAKIKMRAGDYNLDVRAAANSPEFETKLAAVNVPNDIPEENKATPEEEGYLIALEKKISTQKFTALWTSNEWQMPSEWTVRESKMKINGTGVALPRNEQNRYYTDFQMISNVRSLDGKDVGFVIRATDALNYYLLQISGANSAERYRFSFFIVRNGKPELLGGAPIEHLASTIQKQRYFGVVIKGKDNVFKIALEDGRSGQTMPLGDVVDRDNTFRKGAIGIAARDNASFEVGEFTICTPACQ